SRVGGDQVNRRAAAGPAIARGDVKASAQDRFEQVKGMIGGCARPF
ncbi:MAG: hypothetical protein QOF66_5925, partial [Mycobacterium sp.]|nr:hypothetical protein [Mycobacterium sp.]